ncbi:hypothetical protein VTH06DRAFT_872 [Thermothelomyces fergusii]
MSMQSTRSNGPWALDYYVATCKESLPSEAIWADEQTSFQLAAEFRARPTS